VAVSRFSPFVIKALVDAITGGAGNDQLPPIGIYRSGRKIEQFFLDCGLDMRIGASSRVPATTDFLRNTARQWDGDQALERIIARVTDPRDYLAQPEKGQAVLESLNAALQPDGLAVVSVGGKSQLVEKGAAGVSLRAFAEKVALLDFDTVQRDIERALGSVKDDPEDAVTSACSLIEAVCRSILIELSMPLPAKKDIDGLIRAVQEPIGLPESRPSQNLPKRPLNFPPYRYDCLFAPLSRRSHQLRLVDLAKSPDHDGIVELAERWVAGSRKRDRASCIHRHALSLANSGAGGTQLPRLACDDLTVVSANEWQRHVIGHDSHGTSPRSRAALTSSASR